MKKFLILILLFIAGCDNTPDIDGRYNKNITINSTNLIVEIVDDIARRKLGLSGRNNMCNNCGMLFIFDHSDTYSFWMKDMLFSIDIIWINDGIIVEIIKNAEIPSDKKTASYTPLNKANTVLEVNSGFVERNNINIGDKILTKKE